jgi:hypothetical protein
MPLRAAHLPITLLALWLLLCGNQPPPNHTFTFGISLNTGVNNQLFTLFVVKLHGMEVLATEPMTREQFMLQAQGVVQSKANPHRENFFRKYAIEACLPPDTTQYYPDCHVFDDLWKLRFWEYPFKVMNGYHPGRGWAGKKDSPTPQQMMKLADFGLMRLSGLVHGENMFRLLHAVSDSSWVDEYRRSY